MIVKTKCGFVILFIVLNTFIAEAQNADATYSNQYSYTSINYVIKTQIYKLSEKQLHAQAVRQDNELVQNSPSQSTSFYENPLQLNGQVLDYGNFDLMSRGFLAIVRGNPDSKDAEAVPFYVSIRRNGKIVENKKMSFLNKAVNKINLSEVLPFCKEGDVLIVNPSKAEDWQAKRILKLLGGGC